MAAIISFGCAVIGDDPSNADMIILYCRDKINYVRQRPAARGSRPSVVRCGAKRLVCRTARSNVCGANLFAALYNIAYEPLGAVRSFAQQRFERAIKPAALSGHSFRFRRGRIVFAARKTVASPATSGRCMIQETNQLYIRLNASASISSSTAASTPGSLLIIGDIATQTNIC